MAARLSEAERTELEARRETLELGLRMLTATLRIGRRVAAARGARRPEERPRLRGWLAGVGAVAGGPNREPVAGWAYSKSGTRFVSGSRAVQPFLW